MEKSSATAASASANRVGWRANVDTSAALAEVWGDTVDLKHLAWAVILGVSIGVAAFEAGQWLLASIVHDAAIVRADAMLVGLGGCLVAGVVSAVLFKPKRVVREHAVDESERIAVLDQLANEWGGIGALAELSASARAELEALGLLELFVTYESRGKGRRMGEH